MKWLGRAVLVVVCVLAFVVIAWAQDTTATGGGGGNPFASILAFVNDPQWKLALAFVGGFIMRAVPSVVNRSIPFVLQLSGLVTTIIGALFGVQFQPGAVTAMIGNLEPQTGAVMAMGLLGSLSLGAILDSVASIALASGVQSQIKNVAQWWTTGREIVRKVRQ